MTGPRPVLFFGVEPQPLDFADQFPWIHHILGMRSFWRTLVILDVSSDAITRKPSWAKTIPENVLSQGPGPSTNHLVVRLARSPTYPGALLKLKA